MMSDGGSQSKRISARFIPIFQAYGFGNKNPRYAEKTNQLNKQTIQMKNVLRVLGLLAAGVVPLTHAELVEFYIGIDGRQTLTSGVYTGQPNPNANRLTFFYGHAYGYVPGVPASG